MATNEYERALAATFLQLVATIKQLRDPVGGCPWDTVQTHATLRRFMIEEAYEAAEAMAGTDMRELAGELGDVMLQVILNAQIANESGNFTLVDVMQILDEKMKRRHPHVFSGKKGVHDAAAVHKQWVEIKAKEKVDRSDAAVAGIFTADERVQPAMRQALAIGKTSATVKFDWSTADEVWGVVLKEVEELKQAQQEQDESHIAEEWGDVMFSLVQFARHRGFDPEVALLDANRKFLRRFASMEALATQRALDVRSLGLEQLDKLWNEVKTTETKKKR